MLATSGLPFFVYMPASKRNGTLYAGMTDDLPKRIWQHKTKAFDGFTAKYGVDKLIWCEVHDSRESAILRERQIKRWKRAWKIALIAQMNPAWNDLYEIPNRKKVDPCFRRDARSV